MIQTAISSSNDRQPVYSLNWNHYLYCRNDPINMIDPDGENAIINELAKFLSDVTIEWATTDKSFVDALKTESRTVQIGVFESGGGATGENVSWGVIASGSWNSGMQIGTFETVGGGSYFGLNYGVGLEFSVSDGDEVTDVNGPSLEIGGALDVGPACFGATGNIPQTDGSMDQSGVIRSYNIGFSKGVTPGDIHIFQNFTFAQPLLNLANPYVRGETDSDTQTD